MEDVIKIIKKFLLRYNVDEIEGVLLYGSVVSGRRTKKSDIDILVCLNSNEGYQSVGCSIVDGVKVEYFVHHIDSIYELALKEIEKNDPSHLTKFITSKIVYDKNGKFTEEIKKIRDLYTLPIREKHDPFVKKKMFHIKNRLDDLESIKDNDIFYILYFDILNKIRELDTEINGYIVIPLAKSEKLFKDKTFLKEYIESDIHKTSTEEFKSRYLECLKIKDREIMIKNIIDLYDYTFKDEEFDSDEFELTFKVEDGFGIWKRNYILLTYWFMHYYF